MTPTRSLVRSTLITAFSASFLLAAEQRATAQVLLAQTGTSKTAIGWLIVLLCIGLGLLVVCRPAARNPIEVKKITKTKL